MKDQGKRLERLERDVPDDEYDAVILCSDADDEAALLAEQGLPLDANVMFIRLVGVKPCRDD